MRLSQMRYFQAACQYNSLSQAAEALHISQPSISIAIRDLESKFGVSLFHRTNKQLTLTEEGRYFLGQVTEILNRVEELEIRMSDMGGHKNNLRLSILPATSSYLMPPILTRFQQAYPEIRIELKECGARQAKKKLENGECDAALTIKTDELTDAFEGVVLQDTEFFFCVTPSHPKAGLKTVSIGALQDDPLILFQDDSFLTTEVKKRFNEFGLRPNVMLYAFHLPLILELLCSGKIGTFLTKEMAEATRLKLSMIALEEPIKVTYVLVWPKRKVIHRDVLKFTDFAKEQYPAFLG